MPENNEMRARAGIDVIILSWNRVDDTLAAIDSALRQRDVGVNVQVVDQGTEPEGLRRLRAQVQSDRRIHLVELGHNIGVAGGRNRATAMGSSPIVVALDSDAVFAHDRVLHRVVREFHAREELGAMAFRITNYFTRENDATSWDYPANCSPSNRFACSRFVGAGHAVRRALFESLGGYDRDLFFCGEELDLCYRILNCGYTIEYVPEAEILHKVSPEHRVFWNRGRYFFTVRNNLYTSYKFGVPLPRLLVAAGAFIVKGGFNGVGGEALRGVREAIRMGKTFNRDERAVARYCLRPETWARIQELEPWRQEPWSTKLIRQFRHLPNQA